MIRNSIVVQQPVETVFNYVAQFDKHPEWQPDLKEIEFTGPAAIGKIATQTRQMGPRTHTYQSRVSAFDPPHTIGFETLTGPMRPAGTMRFSPEGEGTRFDFEMNMNSQLAPMFERRSQRTIADHLERFKAILERPA